VRQGELHGPAVATGTTVTSAKSSRATDACACAPSLPVKIFVILE